MRGRTRISHDGPFDPERVRDLAGEIYDAGHDCAETLVRVFSQLGVVRDVDLDTFHLLASGFGKGMGRTRGNCGALTGAVLVINAVHGRNAKRTRDMYKLTGAFTKRFEKAFGELTCRELLRARRTDCREKTCAAAALLADFLAEQ